MLPTVVAAQAKEFTFTKTGPTTATGPIITRAHAYDTAPSAIQEGNEIKVWYCGGGQPGDPYRGHDSIYYASYNATTGAPITQPRRVVWVTLNDAFDDGDMACAVTVIKHQNPYIANFSGVMGASQYKMWYECAPRTYRKDNGQLQTSFTEICHAASDDGINWRKYEALSASSFRFNQQSTVVQNNPVKATAVITLSQGIKNNLQLERRSDGKLYANFGTNPNSGGNDLATNYGVGHPTAVALPPDANGYQRIQLWYYDSQGSFNNRVEMRVESGDGFHFETPVKTNLLSPNKIKYVNVPVGGHSGFYLATTGPFYLNVFNYSWDGINWFWGDAGKGADFYTNYLANNFNLGSVTGCTTGGGVMVGDQYGRIQSMLGLKYLSTEGGFGINDNHHPGDQCYNADEDNGRGNSIDMFTLTGNLTFVAPTTAPTSAPTSTPRPTVTSVPRVTNTPYPTQKPALQGDIAGSRGATPDGKVDSYDVNALVSSFGKTGVAGFIPADINKDGKVNIFDYSIVVGNFGK